MGKFDASAGILVLTAVAAGLIDVVSFAKLGGVFTSAMTGNLALLGFYAASGAAHAAIKSVSALCGFIAGCAFGTVLGRGKTSRGTVSLILCLEALIILVCSLGSLLSNISSREEFIEAEILLLGISMGLQGIVGMRLKQANVVFTTTLIKIVGALLGPAADAAQVDDTKRETAVIVSYLVGAVTAGVAVAGGFPEVLLIAFVAIGSACFCARYVEAA